MAKTTVDISEKAHKELLKIQLDRRLAGEKNVTISSLASEYLDKALGVNGKEDSSQK
ncbi:hypothetical protein [Spirosoma panaciterrae]|uniref:hypothetical protein n=1 Tax=Spirosoma panaciterrae TaxID=496058 RepID=UPI0003741B5B|nr:hypothetical protein [Spirosoma panaciterrae]